MSGHRRYRRRRSSSSTSSSMRASTTETDDDVHGGGHRQRLKRSSASSPPVRRSPASHHSWVLLNRAGAWLDDGLAGDRPTTSAMSRTSKGDEISVSFELVEPPAGTSVLAAASATATTTTPMKSIKGNVVAAHRDVVLLAITTTYQESTYSFRDSSVIDLFVYQASRDRDRRHPSRRRRPSPPLLLLLPSVAGHRIYSSLLTDGEIGIMSCRSNDADDSPAFVVAELRIWPGSGVGARLFRSGSGEWEFFENMHVHGANGGRDLRWWSTDAVVPYGRRRCMIWVDYYRGMVIMDLCSSQSDSETTTTAAANPRPPRLRYVPLPVNKVENPEDIEFGGRGCPKFSRRVCVTGHGVKFVSVDSQHWSDFGVGNHHVREWSHRFRITTWWLREDDDGCTWRWRRDLTMHEEEFWDAFDGGRRFRFPHVEPRFPVVDVDNPDVVVFRIEKPGWSDRDEPRWMIEVDLRKKVLLAATPYSKERDYDAITSELPRYLDDGRPARRGGNNDISLVTHFRVSVSSKY